jgi:formate hydrogenlyase transcriptional activator
LVNNFTARIGKRLDGVSRRAIQELQEYSWPGNIRELENVLERAVILATGTTLDLVPGLVATPPATLPAVAKVDPQADENNAATTLARESVGRPQPRLEDVERDYLLAVLKQTNWVITGPRGAAKILDLHPSTLRSRMKKLVIKRTAHEMS